jgi:hypothetical protein
MKVEREARKESRHRNATVDENLQRFEEMLKGTPEVAPVVRHRRGA